MPIADFEAVVLAHNAADAVEEFTSNAMTT